MRPSGPHRQELSEAEDMRQVWHGRSHRKVLRPEAAYQQGEDVGQILNNQLNPIGFYNVDLINEDNPIPLEVSEALALANLDDDVYHDMMMMYIII